MWPDHWGSSAKGSCIAVQASQTHPYTHWHHPSALLWPYFYLCLLWKHCAVLTFVVWSEGMKNRDVSSAYCWQWILETWLNNLLRYPVIAFHSWLTHCPLSLRNVLGFHFLSSCFNFMELGRAVWSLWQSLFNTLLTFVVPSFHPTYTRTQWWFMVQRWNGPMWWINFAHLLRTSLMSVSFRRRCP